MANFTFRESDHIFFTCYFKNHMTFFCDFWSKIIEYILKIFLIFLESSAKNIENANFYFI
jgi:hypothetical protein